MPPSQEEGDFYLLRSVIRAKSPLYRCRLLTAMQCEPVDRHWPEQKCQRCTEHGLPCSENQVKKPGGNLQHAQGLNTTSHHAQSLSTDLDTPALASIAPIVLAYGPDPGEQLHFADEQTRTWCMDLMDEAKLLRQKLTSQEQLLAEADASIEFQQSRIDALLEYVKDILQFGTSLSDLDEEQRQRWHDEIGRARELVAGFELQSLSALETEK